MSPVVAYDSVTSEAHEGPKAFMASISFGSQPRTGCQESVLLVDDRPTKNYE